MSNSEEEKLKDTVDNQPYTSSQRGTGIQKTNVTLAYSGNFQIALLYNSVSNSALTHEVPSYRHHFIILQNWGQFSGYAAGSNSFMLLALQLLLSVSD